MTLRAKLLTIVLSLVAIALVISDVASAAALRAHLLGQLDKDLAEGHAAAVRRIEVTPTPSSTGQHHSIARDNDQQLLNDFYVEIRLRDGTVDDRLQPSVRDDTDPPPHLPHEVVLDNVDNGPFTVSAINRDSFRYRTMAATSSDDKIIIVAVPLQDVSNAMQRLVWAEIVVTIAVLISLGAIGWWIVRRELRPLHNMTLTADAIAAGDLSQRVTAYNPKTEVGRLSEALNTMLSQIETAFDRQQASEERLRRFAADASHELRTPLTAIRGYAELYRQGAIVDEDHLNRVLMRIEHEATRMGLMVEDLLLLARLDQNRPFENESVNLVSLIEAVVNDARASTADYGINTSSEQKSVVINGDSARLHQVFANLVGNALSHTPPGTRIEITTTIDNNFAEIRVADNGPGISQEEGARVFERFYRVDVGRSRDTGGTGLGLAIVKSIVEKHHGTVDLESELGKGATFIVRLPLDQRA